MTTKRKAISKRMRFEVLKRDMFTCQYCGKQPPDTVLHMDHIKPVSKGGKNSLLNLVTSCVDCNLGKSDVELSDDSAIKKQKLQLSLMAEKKAQIEMMVQWRESLLDADEILVVSAEKLIDKYLESYGNVVSEQGTETVRKAIKKHGYTNVINAIEKCYINSDNFLKSWSKSIEHAGTTSKKNIHYIKGVLKNTCGYINETRFYIETKNIKLNESNYSIMFAAAKDSESLDEFLDSVQELV